MSENQLRREAVLAAESVLADLNLPDGAKVPVFDMIEDRGIWLSFQPLDRLLGLYQRVGDTAGIAINLARPLAMQRFTAAHELGHHELGHESHTDDEATIENYSADPQELQAQTFAASLLMSESAVEAQLERLAKDVDRPDLNALDIYQISVELGVSYTAAITQLGVLKKINRQRSDEATKLTPLRLKQQILGGRRPDNARAAVWRLGLEDNHRAVFADLGDELDIALPEIRSTGYEWSLTSLDADTFAIVNDRFEERSDSLANIRYGTTRTRHVTLKARTSGPHAITFELLQPWAGGDRGSTLNIFVEVASPVVSDVGQGISVNQQPQLLAA